MTVWNEILDHLKPYQKIGLLVHEKPDGDCLGSALALGLYLCRIGFSATLYLPEPLPSGYAFLPGRHLLANTTENRLPSDMAIITVDVADKNRLGYDLPVERPIVNIDHHVSNDSFGTYNLVEPEAAAVGEIIYRLIEQGEGGMTPEEATCLYVALATDSGSFCYSNTTATTFKIAAHLIERDADMALIRTNLYDKRPAAELLLIKEALSTMDFSKNGRIVYALLTYSQLQQQELLSIETDNLLNLMRGTENVEGVLLFKETAPGVIRVSFRSKTTLDVNQLAQEFGGGGHSRAAGCTVHGELAQVSRDILARAESYLKGLDV